MNPIRVVLFTVSLFFTLSAFAQYSSLTFVGGANAAGMSIEHGNAITAIEDSYGMLYGGHVGALYDYVFHKNKSQELSIESGILLDSRGYSQSLDDDIIKIDNTTSLYYVDVPLYLKYIHRFRSRNKIYLGTGPYAGFGVYGTFKNIEGESETISWGDDSTEDHFKRLDYGISTKIGFLWLGGFSIVASYDYGLANVSAIETKEYRNRLMRLSLGYTLKYD